jgi:hypothetical protein
VLGPDLGDGCGRVRDPAVNADGKRGVMQPAAQTHETRPDQGHAVGPPLAHVGEPSTTTAGWVGGVGVFNRRLMRQRGSAGWPKPLVAEATPAHDALTPL